MDEVSSVICMFSTGENMIELFKTKSKISCYIALKISMTEFLKESIKKEHLIS